MDRDADVAVLRGADAERVLEPRRKVRAGRCTRVGADGLCPCRRARRDARVPERFAREHELKCAGEQQQREREQRDELGRGLPSLCREGAKPGGDGAARDREGATPGRDGAARDGEDAKPGGDGAARDREDAKPSRDGAARNRGDAKPGGDGAARDREGAARDREDAQPGRKAATSDDAKTALGGDEAPPDARLARAARQLRGVLDRRPRAAHASRFPPDPVTGLREFVTKVRQYDV